MKSDVEDVRMSLTRLNPHERSLHAAGRKDSDTSNPKVLPAGEAEFYQCDPQERIRIRRFRDMTIRRWTMAVRVTTANANTPLGALDFWAHR